MTVCINLFGGPGIGKSTFAAALYAELKRRHCLVEMTTEYAKDLIWEGRAHLLSNQIAVLGGQWDRITRLVGKVDLIVNDSPVLLCSIYAPSTYPADFHDLAWWCHQSVRSVNFLLSRHEGDYQAVGRVQDEATARRIDRTIESVLSARGADYERLPAGDGAVAAAIASLDSRGLLAAAGGPERAVAAA